MNTRPTVGSTASCLGLVFGSPAAFALGFFGILRATANQQGWLALAVGLMSYLVVLIPLSIIFKRTIKRMFEAKLVATERHLALLRTN